MKRPFKSGLAPKFEEYTKYLEASGRLNHTYYENLHYFDNHIAENFANETELSEAMLLWCHPRESENGNSCRVRTTAIKNFVSYANLRGWTDIKVWSSPTNVPDSYIPHFFTREELQRFFRECDNYFISHWNGGHLNMKLNRLELPVYYRLLLSTGLRTCEARWLKRSDVDFATGVVNVRKSKGHDEHRIVLGESALAMLKKYDCAMETLVPGRKHLFPDKNDNCHPASWGGYYFRIIWPKVSKERACEYDLRSTYAVMNISKWENHGFELSGKLLFLSRSMGHRSINSTFGYFHLTPMLSDKLRRNTSSHFADICPQIPEYED